MTMTEEKKDVADVEYKFDVKMSNLFKEKIDYFSLHYDLEIGGFIIGEFKEDEVYLEDLIFPKQTVSSAEVEIGAKEMVLMRKEYGDLCLKMIGQWHSHNSMGAFWSSTDDNEMIERYMKNHDTGLFIVSSKGNHLIRIDCKKPFYFKINNLDYSVEEVESPLTQELKKVISDKLTEKRYTTSIYTENYSPFYNGYKQTTLDEKELEKEYQEISSVEDLEKLDEIYSTRSYNPKRENLINETFYDLLRQNKKEFMFDIVGIPEDWVDEIIATIGNEFTLKEDIVSHKYDLRFKFDNKKKFKSVKKEVKDLLFILIDEELKKREK